MVRKKHGIIIETPTEARQAERGPSVLVLLTVSLIAVAIGMAAVWFIFFRTSAGAVNSSQGRSHAAFGGS
jgi:hypothetical protein